MLIQQLKGGLGNQMFQYAFIRSLSLIHNTKFYLDISRFDYYDFEYQLNNFNIVENIADRSMIPFSEKYFNHQNKISYILKYFFRKLNPNIHTEKKFGYDERMIKFNKGYFIGYFASYLYFDKFRDLLLKEFIPKNDLDNKNKEYLKIIRTTKSVSIHIRRGDYLKGNNPKHFRICSKEYYDKAISFIKKRIGNNLTYFFFSDDIEWVKKNFNINNAYYMDFNVGKDAYKDLILISNCRYNIIANSTFSWRGAYLNRNKDKLVIAPKKWFVDKKFEEYKDIYTPEMVLL